MKKEIILAIVGMTGSGKSEAGSFFQNKGFVVLRFGSVIDDAIRADGLPWTPENNVVYRKKVREELGMAAVAIKMLSKIQNTLNDNEKIILDGLYSWEEYVLLKEKLPSLIVLAIYARPNIRYERLEKRKARPFSKVDAKRRDVTEIEDIHKAGPIAMADFLIKNESTIEEYRNELEIFWKTLW